MLSTLRSSRLFVAVALVAWSGPVSAESLIRITEVMSKSGDADPTPDWFEITNYGTSAVDLTGWKMDDNSFSLGVAATLSPFTTSTSGNPWGTVFELNPGESAVFLETAAGAALPAYQTFWNLGSDPENIRNPKLGFYTGSGLSLSSGGDGLIIFAASGAEVTRVNFGAATTGNSFYWSYDQDGQLATARLGTVSVVGSADAYVSTGGLNNTGSPGAATVAANLDPRYWTANGTALGGDGVWDTSSNRWAPTLTIGGGIPAGSATTWSDGASAIFDSNTATGGTVTVNADVRPLGLNILKDGYVLAAGSGSIATSSILVTTGTATIGARLTGDQTIGISGGGTLVLTNPANDYTGITSVAEGTVRSGASNVVPDVSRITISRFATYDFAGFSDTVAGFAGLGSVRMDGVLTVNITDATDAEFNGFLSGSGGLVIDSAGTGRQVLRTTTQTLNQDFAVKDYSGATLVRRGTLAINETAQPIGTSGVTIEAGGRLELTSDAATYQMGSSPTTIVTLAGGTLGQEAGEDVTLTNAINVTADSTIVVANSNTPDLLDPTVEFIRLTGPLAGAAGRTLTLASSNTTPGQDRALVDFASPTGNTFAGTIAAGINMSARFAGDYSSASVTLAGGLLEGAGSVGAVTGSGTAAPGLPDGDLAPGLGILTVTTLPAVGFNYQFEFQNANLDPFWSTPDFSGNDVLRLTGAEPFGGASLTAANEVRLLLDVDVASLAETDTFRGGFFSITDLSAAIADATYSVFVRDNTIGITPDLTVSGVNYVSLATWNAANSTDYGAAISMVPVDALFDGVTTTSGYLMQLSLAGEAPPPPGPDYTGGYIVNPAVGDNEDIPWGSLLAWAPTGPTEGFTFVPPKAGDSIAVNKLEDGRRNVDLGGAQAVGDIASTVDGNENAQTNGGVRFRGGVLTLDTGDGSESLVTYSGSGNGRLEFRFDGAGEGLVFANDVRVVADNTAGQVDIRGAVSGSGTLTKAGAGELRFTATFDETSGANLFNATGLTGDVVVEQGVVALGDQVTLPAVPSVRVAAGATFDVSAQAGGYAMPTGQTLSGNGTVEGSVTIGTSATLSPGASPGTLTVTGNVTLSSGGNYNWQIYDAAGTAGSATGWDLLSVGGVLDIAATSADRFNLNLWSISGVGPDVNGSAVNWNSSQNGSWKVASAAGGITGFVADKFTINTVATNGTAGFANDLAGGTFAVVQQGNDLILQFTADAPEPVAPVKVTGVYVKGSAWNASYLARTPFATVEGATVGWELPDGSAQLADPSNVSWNNVNVITIEFDQPISQPAAAALQLVRGTTDGNESIALTLTPTLLGDGSAAQWSLPAALDTGRYVISLAADGIRNAEGTAGLDGEWITGESTFIAGSGDGIEGGTFNFFFNALIGDVNGNGVMNGSDIGAIRANMLSALNTPLASDSLYRLDINGSNNFNSSDISQTRSELTSSLGTRLSSLPAVTAPAEEMAMGFGATGLTVAPVPEPGGLGLMAGGLVALLTLGLRRRMAGPAGLWSSTSRLVATIRWRS